MLSPYAKRKMKRIAKNLEVHKQTVDIDPAELDVCTAIADQV